MLRSVCETPQTRELSSGRTIGATDVGARHDSTGQSQRVPLDRRNRSRHRCGNSLVKSPANRDLLIPLQFETMVGSVAARHCASEIASR